MRVSKILVISLIICVVVLGFIFVLAGCNEKAEQDSITYLIGVSQANLIDPWQIALKQEIESKALDYTNIKVLYSDAGGSNEKQKTDIEDMLVQQVDLIIIFPNDVDYISDTLAKAYEDGTHVILLGYPTKTDSYTARIFTDNYKIGKMAGEYAAELLSKQGIVLEFQGDPMNQISVDRKKGFLDGIEQYQGVVKEYVTVGYWSRDYALEVLESSELLKRTPEIDLVFAHNDDMAIGASKLIKILKRDIFVIGIDGMQGSNQGIEAVNNGLIDATITYPTGGSEAMEYAVRLLQGEQIPKEIELDAKLITCE